MDFGDILSQWDSIEKKASQPKKGPQKSNKKPNAMTKEQKMLKAQGYSYEQQMEADSKKRANPIDVWLNRHGTVDKDKISDEAENEARMHNRDYLRFVADSVRRGFRKILIIHGKGNHSHGSDPVLGPMVRTFIEQNKRLGASGHPDRNGGGNGATWVLIKN